MSPHVISTRFPNLFRTLARLALAFLLSASVQAATDVQQSSIRGGGLSAFGASVVIDDCQSATWELTLDETASHEVGTPQGPPQPPLLILGLAVTLSDTCAGTSTTLLGGNFLTGLPLQGVQVVLEGETPVTLGAVSSSSFKYTRSGLYVRVKS
ncbi:hypothetical protein CHLRE_11g467780v5 [Chlamydomonas reinhardtii]|uniref:Pherophorin domain-containing protein n=1 Tax=Chlamydomonas reinhardtii TaxID=3055 RepID=A0A2K3D803_CHLRE|nr:uncharacterized protein CHLRE_11g467780v5 [Chlamydomonas reinhardtii]PNW76660.1 hypothetical protein CHLRE_11g467780v5 [Chlamydomonas reinhardtii]